MDAFPFSTEIKVRFAETDAQGIAHHASFVVWLEVARVEYLERFVGGYQAIRAAVFDERLTIEARCVDLRGARFRYEYRVTRAGELVAEAWTNHAVVDAETYRPTRLPDWLADAIARAGSASSEAAASPEA
jgi:acyl-CoA thioester hydrolase